MSKRTLYTVVTPLPATITRETAIAVLHDHAEMIQLNPLVINHERSTPAANSPPDEFHAIWYTLTDRISYLPGVKGKVSYKACFHDLPNGLQTHVYAPAGLEIKEKWSIGGNAPGEEREVLELGLFGVPRDGLYLREDVDMSCSIFLTSFVKKNLRKAHSVLVERLVVKADLEEDRRVRSGYSSRIPSLSLSHSSFAPSLRSRSSMGSSTAGVPNKRLSVNEFLVADHKAHLASQPSSPIAATRPGSMPSTASPYLARPAGSIPAANGLGRRESNHFSPHYQGYQLPDSSLLHQHQPSEKLHRRSAGSTPSYAPLPPPPFTLHSSHPYHQPAHMQHYSTPMSKTSSSTTMNSASSSNKSNASSSHPVIIAELEGDETHVAPYATPYATQQSWHEEQIWRYLENHKLAGNGPPMHTQMQGLTLAAMGTPTTTPGIDGATPMATPPPWPVASHHPYQKYGQQMQYSSEDGNSTSATAAMRGSRAPSVAYSMSIYNDEPESQGTDPKLYSSPAIIAGATPPVPPVPARALGRLGAELA